MSIALPYAIDQNEPSCPFWVDGITNKQSDAQDAKLKQAFLDRVFRSDEPAEITVDYTPNDFGDITVACDTAGIFMYITLVQVYSPPSQL